jgi:hypothetical protein
MNNKITVKQNNNNNNRKNPSNPIVYFLTYLYRWSYYLLYLLYISIHNEKKVTINDPIKSYIENNKSKLISYFDVETRNNNIEKIFYDKKELLEILKNQNNELEKIWKTRILFENSPRGNIIMYYDAYKQGFSYYTDVNGIPYNILNAVAMKYIIRFRCHDFFMDNEYLDEQKESPLIKLYLEYEKSNEKKTDNDNNNKKVSFDENAPFAKLKNYKINLPSKNEDKKETADKTEKKVDKEYNRNIFIHMGKVSNFQFLQKVPKKNKLNGFRSSLLNGIECESEIQNEVLSYSQYKELLKKKEQ